MDTWSKPAAGTDKTDAPHYWSYYGSRLVEQAGISAGMRILDIGCGSYGSSFFPALARVGEGGCVIGFDQCRH